MPEDDFIALSALQHYLYCPRQCALIHVERAWTENMHTAQGQLLHQRANIASTEQRHGVRTATAMPLSNKALKISGVADIVELVQENGTIQSAMPVEYKKGRPKQHQADEVQLCAQALCLEEMLNIHIEQGTIFYGKTRRRITVVFDAPLRKLTQETIENTRTMIDSGITPKVSYDAKRCDACSLIDDCQPHWLNTSKTVNQWLRDEIGHIQ